MSYIQKIIDNVGNLQSKSTDLEIELKYLIDPRGGFPGFARSNFNETSVVSFVKHIISKFKNTGSRFAIEETINFIENSEPNIIKQLVFKDGVQDKSKKNFYIKKQITKPIFITAKNSTAVKISFAEEKKITERNVKTDLVRAKLRLTIFPDEQFTELSKWKIDITLTKTLKKISSISEIKKIRDNLFPPGICLENFESTAPWKYADLIEMEVESLHPGDVSEESIAQVDKELQEGISIEKQQDDEVQNKFYEIAQMLSPKIAHTFKSPSTRGFKSLSNNAIELNRSMFFTDLKPNIQDYLITDKADGFRVFLHINNNTAEIITSDSVKSIEIPKSDISGLVDAEMVGDQFLLFDVMMFGKEKVYLMDFSERVKYLNRIANISPRFHAKKFVDCNPETCNIADVVKEFYEGERKIAYEIDGLIFTSKTGTYAKTLNYKWKPTKDTTIDFLVKQCPKSLLGIDPYVSQKNKVLYLLFVGIDKDMLHRININPIRKYKEIFPMAMTNKKYRPIQFSPSSRPHAYLFWHERTDLDNKIVELHYDAESKSPGWDLRKIRDDKTSDAEKGIAFGNDFRIAELTWQNYFNPITIQDLASSKEEGMANVYFKEHNVEFYKALRVYNSFVKESLYKPFHNIPWSIDFGAGKGQDLFRYLRAGVKNVLFIDIDKMALNELINRKYSFTQPKYNQKHTHNQKTNQKPDQNSNQKLGIYILQADLNQDYKTNIEKIKDNGIPVPSKGVPLIVCNFAIHYMVGNNAMRKNFMKLVDSLLAPGGRFIYTTFDGEKVFKLLDENDGKWNLNEGDKLKYSIHAEYIGARFTGNDQKIKVLHPFSETTYYSEYLVNNDILQKSFKKIGMSPEISESFDIYYDAFKTSNPKMFSQLTTNDKQYISLYMVGSYLKS